MGIAEGRRVQGICTLVEASALLPLSQHHSFPLKEANLLRQLVEVVGNSIVRTGGHASHIAQFVSLPGCQYQQSSAGAGLKACLLGFSQRTDGFLLQVYERVALLQAFSLHLQLALRDAGLGYIITSLCST